MPVESARALQQARPVFTPLDLSRAPELMTGLPPTCLDQASAVFHHFRWRGLLVHEGSLVAPRLALSAEHADRVVIVTGSLEVEDVELRPRANTLFVVLGDVRCGVLSSTVHFVTGGSVAARSVTAMLDTGSFTVGGNLSAQVVVEDQQVLSVSGDVTASFLTRDDAEAVVVEGPALAAPLLELCRGMPDRTLGSLLTEYARTGQPLLADAYT